MSDIEEIIKFYKEDHPEIIITDDMVKALIVLHIDKLVKEIKEGVNNLWQY